MRTKLNTENKHAFEKEHQYATKSCKDILNLVQSELKEYKKENIMLKEECSRLKQAYQDMVSQFSKMQEL